MVIAQDAGDPAARTSSATRPTGTPSGRSPIVTTCSSSRTRATRSGHTLRGTPTGTRADISLTSFANSHIITCAGNGGMVLLDDEDLRDRGLLLRRWGRRSEVQLYGTRQGERDFWEDLDGIRYDNMFIFDELGVELRAVGDGRGVRACSS